MMSPKRTVTLLLLLALGWAPAARAAGGHAQGPPPAKADQQSKLDDELTKRANAANPRSKTSVIVELVPGAQLSSDLSLLGKVGRRLGILNAHVMEVPDTALRALASHPNVSRVHYNRPVRLHNYRTSVTVGARAVQDNLGLTGTGVGVAIIDSGITSWHDDLMNRIAAPVAVDPLTGVSSGPTYTYSGQRVAAFVDFVSSQVLPYDDNGHGTHVAGTIAGNGYDTYGEKAGIAPDASIVSLKALDAKGAGVIANVIAAMDWVATNAAAYNIRVVNVSLGAAVTQSYWTDPLTVAAKRLVDKGIVVVAAAGNLGLNPAGVFQYGGITAPGNAPWVLTVGASSTMGTVTRADDTMANFSSHGPTWIDFSAKPDLVAPGVGTWSLAVPGSTLYQNNPTFLEYGTVPTPYMPYLALTGTSMAAPVATGTVALMLQANPSLTPNLVKAILQYTAQVYPGYNGLVQGAGFLNSLGAVRLAAFYAHAQPGQIVPTEAIWSRQVIWGNHRLRGGVMVPSKNAWKLGVTWGVAKLDIGDNIIWGTSCGLLDCGDNIIWGTDGGDNIIWGTSSVTGINWGTAANNIIWGTSGTATNIIWGTGGGDNIIWGTQCGGGDCPNVIWGTVDATNIIWGTADGTNIIWGTSSTPNGTPNNIIWGTDGSTNIIWGTDGGDNIIWGTVDGTTQPMPLFPDATEPLPSVQTEFGDFVALVPGGLY